MCWFEKIERQEGLEFQRGPDSKNLQNREGAPEKLFMGPLENTDLCMHRVKS